MDLDVYATFKMPFHMAGLVEKVASALKNI